MSEQPIVSNDDSTEPPTTEPDENVEDPTEVDAETVLPEPDGTSSNVIALRLDGALTGRGSLSITPDQDKWTEYQYQALRDRFDLTHAPNGKVREFLHQCQVTGLDPFRGEIHFIGRKSSTGGVVSPVDGVKRTWTSQTGIDGFRHLAERTGEYRGRTVQWCGPDGQWVDVWLDKTNPPAAARVGILRETLAIPVYGIATYDEFVPMYAGKPQGLWDKMPSNQLAKCAEAQAIRAAFPRQAAGVYVHEEMHQAEQAEQVEVVDERTTRRRSARRAATAGERAANRTLDVEVESTTVIEGAIVDVEVTEETPVDRDAAWAELEAQASLLSTTVTALARRWVKAHKRNIDDATAEEIAALATSMRPTAAEAMRSAGKPAIADSYAANTAPVVDLGALLAAPEPRQGLGHTYIQAPDPADPFCVSCGGDRLDH
jgi:phage recombination protein Bet